MTDSPSSRAERGISQSGAEEIPRSLRSVGMTGISVRADRALRGRRRLRGNVLRRLALVLVAVLLVAGGGGVACDPGHGETRSGTADLGAGASAAAPATGDDAGESADPSGAEPATPVPPAAAVERPGGDWERVAPGAAGLDPELVAAGVAAIGAQPGVRTVLVVRDGKIVAEEGFRGADPAAPHNMKSASKSILSALVGIAIEEGVFTGVDQPLAELLPGALPEGEAGRERGRITLRHLLTQTSGLESTSGENYGRWVSSPDWVEAALARPLLDPPGATFRYSTGNTHLVSAALARAAGTSTLDFARRHLLDPLGVRVADWSTDPQGIHLGGNEMSLTPRDLARFGWLVLRGGRWGDRQLGPADWIRASTSRQVATTPEWTDRYGSYGYLWWIPPDRPGDAMAVGFGGQFLYLAPAERMAIVVTATLEGKGAAWDRELLTAARDTLLASVAGPAAR